MKQGAKKIICLLIAGEFFLFQLVSVSWAKRVEIFDPKKVSVAVLPYPSSVKDRPLIEKTSAEIREKLNKIPYFHVVKPKRVNEVLGYHADYVKKSSKITKAERYLGLAKTHWFDRQYGEAEATVDAAIDSFRNQPGKGELLVDALLTKAMIFKETKRYADSKKVFQEALAVDPSLTMEGLPITGRSRRIFKKTRREVLERHSGGLDIKTNPPAALVYLNGIRKGVTPLNLTKLPEGSYLLTLEASNYHTIHQPVVVTANTTQFIDKKLYWASGRTRKKIKEMGVPIKTDIVLQKEIKMATRVGETLKVDKVILVSTQKKGGEELLVVRTIDTALKVGYNPIGMSLDEFLKNEEQATAQIAEDLDHQAKVNVLNNPEEYIEPDLGDVRVLRRKNFFKSPLFYSLLGAFIGAAVGTTVGILVSRGGSGGAGDEGGIDIGFE